MLAVVTIVAAWSGYSAAKWGTESSLHLAKASATRTQANREYQESLTFRVGDASDVQRLARRSCDRRRERDPRRPRGDSRRLRVAFDAWQQDGIRSRA